METREMGESFSSEATTILLDRVVLSISALADEATFGLAWAEKLRAYKHIKSL